jgi:hypothetical protein
MEYIYTPSFASKFSQNKAVIAEKQQHYQGNDGVSQLNEMKNLSDGINGNEDYIKKETSPFQTSSQLNLGMENEVSNEDKR